VRSALRALALLLAGVAGAAGAGRDAGAAHLHLATIAGTINPASADYLVAAVAQAERDGALALLIELDTPGGLLVSTQDVIQAILPARVPVIVYVAPSGAWAGSAGTFITLAAHVAAMAPGTTIGAAHPVSIGAPSPAPEGYGKGDETADKSGARDFAAEKAENFTAAFIEAIAAERKRNVDWAVKAVRESVAIPAPKAPELGVIDLVAADRASLLAQLEGREVIVAGETRKLALAGAEVRPIEMRLLSRFLDVLANPDIAVLLILAGLLGLYVEITTPGVVLPGVLGAASLLLGFFSLQILPFSWLGLVLFLAGIACIVAEAFVTSYGLLFAVGAVCFLLGGSQLFERPDVSDLDVSTWSTLVPALVGVALFGAIVTIAVGRSFVRPPESGIGELVGHRARATTALAPEGTVFVRGEYWSASSASPVEAGAEVEIVSVEGLRLRVRPASANGRAPAQA